MNAIKLMLPLPPRELHKNEAPWTKGAKMRRQRLKRAWTGQVLAIARQQAPPKPFAKASISLHYFVANNQAKNHDDDGLTHWFAAGRDVLQTTYTVGRNKCNDGACIVVNDRHFVQAAPPLCTMDKTNPRLEVTITEIES